MAKWLLSRWGPFQFINEACLQHVASRLGVVRASEFPDAISALDPEQINGTPGKAVGCRPFVGGATKACLDAAQAIISAAVRGGTRLAASSFSSSASSAKAEAGQ